MSEPIGTTIEIGGTLPASLVDEFLKCVTDDIDNLQGDASLEELEEVSGVEPIRYDGTANYGICSSLIKFCKEHDLTYETHSEACGEYNSDTSYWAPGMDEAGAFDTDPQGNPVIKVSEVKPMIDFMYALITKNRKALLLFINDPIFNDLVNVGLQDPEGFPSAVKKRIDSIIPGEPPKVPPLVIDHTK